MRNEPVTKLTNRHGAKISIADFAIQSWLTDGLEGPVEEDV